MDERLRRILMLDTDLDILVALRHVLTDDELDVTITWDEEEAWQLLETVRFDLFLIGHHPPELDAAKFVEALSFRGTCPPVLVLQTRVREQDVQYFRWLGAVGVIANADPFAVRDEVTKALTPMPFKATAAKAGSVDARRWRTAS